MWAFGRTQPVSVRHGRGGRVVDYGRERNYRRRCSGHTDRRSFLAQLASYVGGGLSGRVTGAAPRRRDSGATAHLRRLEAAVHHAAALHPERDGQACKRFSARTERAPLSLTRQTSMTFPTVQCAEPAASLPPLPAL